MASTFKSAASANIGTSATTVYTAPSLTTTTVIGLSVANVSGGSVNIDVLMTKGATTVYLIKGAPLPYGSSMVVVGGDQKVVLEAGNTIQVKSSAATSVDAVISILELT